MKRKKWTIHLNNGKKKTVSAVDRYHAKHGSLSSDELIVGVKKIVPAK